jgi:hypothetical protein
VQNDELTLSPSFPVPDLEGDFLDTRGTTGFSWDRFPIHGKPNEHFMKKWILIPVWI